VLRVLQKAGLSKKDVQLVELPSTGDVYPNALASKLVDVAPISEANRQRYLANYGKDGAKLLPHGLRDDPAFLYVLKSVLRDASKAAAVREYVKAWARATKWVSDHPAEWIKGYYVESQGLTAEDGRYLVDAAGAPDIPANWTDVIARQQATIDLLAADNGKPRLEAADLFDRRYETVAAGALAGE
jgi:sulfonate transport system substrate-binding protein